MPATTRLPCHCLPQEIKGEERIVCHFYRSNNLPCQVIDRHLAELAVKHLETKFVRVHAEKAPFLTGEQAAQCCGGGSAGGGGSGGGGGGKDRQRRRHLQRFPYHTSPHFSVCTHTDDHMSLLQSA